jgi:Tfp pilus assembly PilM family ATPase
MIARRATFGPIGLDVTSHHVAAAQFSAAGELCSAARFARLTPDATISKDEVTRIRDVLDRHGFQGNQTAIGVPDDMLLWSSATLPPRSSGAPIDVLAHTELARSASVEPIDIESECWDLPPSARFVDRTQVISTGCAHALATAFLKPFDEAGCETIAMEPRPCAAAAICHSLSPTAEGIIALIEIGEASSSPQLLTGGVPIYSRTTPEIGLNALVFHIEEQLNLPRSACELLIDHMADPLAFDIDVGVALADIARLIGNYLDTLSDEIKTAIDYAAYCYPSLPMEKVILFGAGARLPGVREHVGQQIGLMPTIATPEKIVRCNEHLADAANDPSLVVAMGLARVGDEA